MLSVEWSDEAQFDLAEIQFYIERFNQSAAIALRENIERAVERLPNMPFAFRPGRVAGTREYVVHPNYIVVYRVGAETLRVLRVLHARQQYP
ncbi:addiction module antitoxin [Betaproteobacteria bacterium]|nr:addiction module antitoxin [Betaproteobacteria bacterium]